MGSKRMPKTQTTPQGLEIPIPTRKDVLGDLGKVAGTARGRSGQIKGSEPMRKNDANAPSGGAAE
jgi:hypothetical protein